MKLDKKTRQKIKALKQERTSNERYFFGTSERRLRKCDCGSGKLFNECCGRIDSDPNRTIDRIELFAQESQLNDQSNYNLEKDITHEES